MYLLPGGVPTRFFSRSLHGCRDSSRPEEREAFLAPEPPHMRPDFGQRHWALSWLMPGMVCIKRHSSWYGAIAATIWLSISCSCSSNQRI